MPFEPAAPASDDDLWFQVKVMPSPEQDYESWARQAMNVWSDALDKQAATLAIENKSAPPEKIVNQTFLACAAEEKAFIGTMQGDWEGRYAAHEFVEELRAMYRPNLMLIVYRTRRNNP